MALADTSPNFQVGLRKASPAPYNAACRGGTCGGSQLSRRLDVLEARVLSNWHEFLVHRQEVQLKFEDFFSGSRATPRSKNSGGMAQHISELDRRVEDCERSISDIATAERSGSASLRIADLDCRLEECKRGIAAVATAEREDTERLWRSGIQGFLAEAKGNTLRQEHDRQEADTALEARLHRMQVDIAEAVQAVQAAGEQRSQQSQLQATSATETFKRSVELRLQQVQLETASAIEAAFSAAEKRGSRQIEASNAMTLLEARLDQGLQYAVKAVETAETSIEERLALERANIGASFATQILQSREEFADSLRSFQVRRREDVSEATSATQQLSHLLEVRVREVHAESTRALSAVAQMEAAVESRARRSGEEAHDWKKRMALMQEDTIKAQADASRALNAETAAEARARRSSDEAHSNTKRYTQAQEDLSRLCSAAQSEASQALRSVGAVEAAAEACARRSDDEVHDCERRLAQVQEAQRYAERLSMEASTRIASHGTATETLRDELASLRREVIVLGEEQGSLLSALEDLRGHRGAADAEVQAILSEVRSGACRQASELARLQGTVQDFGRRLGPVEVTVGTASGDAAGAREEARASLGSVRELREDLGRRLDGLRRDSLQTARTEEIALSDEAASAASRASAAERLAREAKLNSEWAESQAQQMQQDLHREHRSWRLEVDEQVRRLGSLERGALGDEERLKELTSALDVLIHDRHQVGGLEVRTVAELTSKTEGTSSKVTELALTLERLARDVHQGGDRVDMSGKRMQEEVARRIGEFQKVCDVRLDSATRAVEQVRVTEGAQRNELWREVRDLRSAVAELRLRCGSSATPRGLSGFSSRPQGGAAFDLGL